jgi:hypothetical protein
MRALRRHHRNRIILKRYKKVEQGLWYVKSPGQLGKNNTVCSCWMCGNPRKYSGQLTRQEILASLGEDSASANWSSNLKGHRSDPRAEHQLCGRPGLSLHSFLLTPYPLRLSIYAVRYAICSMRRACFWAPLVTFCPLLTVLIHLIETKIWPCCFKKQINPER